MIRLLTHYRRWSFGVALLAAITGIAFVLKHRQHINAHQWEALEVPFSITAGQKVSGDFTAELSEPYEVEIEIDWVLPNETLDRLVYISDEAAPLEIEWQVRRGGDVLSKGDCRDYLYLSEGGHYKKSKLKEALLGIPFHTESPQGTISRGVGSFTAQAGVTYTVSAQVKASHEELNIANPRLVARINREFWTRHLAETQLMAYSGFVFLTLAGVAGFLWLSGIICNQRAST